MRFAHPAGWWFALAVVPVIVVHLLRPRRAAHVVSSTFLWRSIERPVTSATPFKRLRPSWLLLLQLLAVALIASAMANPVRVEATPLAPHTVFLVDGSGSMRSLDGSPDRLADAKTRVLDMVGDLPAGGVASVIEIGVRPRVLLSQSSDADAIAEAIETIDAREGRADFAGAFSLAQGLETADAPIGFVLVSDGGLTEAEERLLPPGTQYEQVGNAATNRAIVALDVEPSEAGLRVVATVANEGGPASTQTLRIDVDGRTRERVELDLGAGSTVVHDVDLVQGDRVEAFLEGEDLLAADNRRTAVAQRRQPIAIAVDGDIDPFLDALLASLDGVEVLDDPTREPDVVVYAGTPVPDSPTTPFLAIRPPNGAPGIVVVGEVESPALTLVVADDPLLQGIDFTDVAIASAQRVESDTAQVLLGAESAPLLLRGRVDGVRFAYLPFDLTDSNLPVQLAFPLLGDRLFAELTGATLPPTAVEVGDTLVVPIRTGGVVTDPNGVVTDLAAGSVGMTADRPGVWTVAAPDRPVVAVAVNPAANESDLTPVPALQTERRPLRDGEDQPTDEASLRAWILAALALVLIAEFLLARRRVGVHPRQWRFTVVLRIVTAVALLGVLFDVGFDRSAGDVATVFVVDASDSLGASGRAEALDYVQSALDDQPAGSRAGVVLFGGDARIEVLLRQQAALGRTTVQIDPSRSDLAAALRLGGAILPSDARRRVVLVSDGRATQGDAEREAAVLRDNGVGVDVVLVDTPSGADVAVASIRAPADVAEGESVPITVDLDSTLSGPAVVKLRRDGELIGTQQVDLVAGTQTLRFEDVADATGPRRYQVDVESRLDSVGQNNTGFAAIEVAGPPRVLMIEGARNAGVELAGALRAGQLDVDVVQVADLPDVTELVSYSSLVLVDVDQRQLTDRQVGALTGAVRDAGRGLVTIGGNQSYGLGGYYTSELESLLPVISEILDPERRQTVAQVLAIDTSGSMGACHCADGQFASNRFDGGVNKTDISRAAAARTIEALSENDEVGVLAFDVEDKWIIDLQKLPAQDVVNQGLASLNPDGGTNPSTSLMTSAAALRESNAALKHIILFTDGFTSTAILEQLADEAADLSAEGITVSVVATGEGATKELSEVAAAGQGRFYPGRDLQQIPEIIMDEAVLASRDFVNEGSFLPTVTSARPAVANLTASPPLLGYIATTAKPGASTLLRIGPDDDPLLSTWQVGLGTSTSWTSDASARWSQQWANWDGYVGFWSNVVRDTFPVVSDGTTAVVDDGVLRIRVEGDTAAAFGDDATAIARITDPTLTGREVTMDRVGADAFVAEVPVDDAGVYVVGTSVEGADGSVRQGTTLASQSYGREYRPGVPDAAVMARIAATGGGRVDITPEEAFDRVDLSAGVSRVALAPWLLALAVIAFALAVVLSRLTLSPSGAVARTSALARTGAVRTWLTRLPRRRAAGAATGGRQRGASAGASSDVVASTPAAEDAAILDEVARSDVAAESATMASLLERTREERRRDRRPPP